MEEHGDGDHPPPPSSPLPLSLKPTFKQQDSHLNPFFNLYLTRTEVNVSSTHSVPAVNTSPSSKSMTGMDILYIHVSDTSIAS